MDTPQTQSEVCMHTCTAVSDSTSHRLAVVSPCRTMCSVQRGRSILAAKESAWFVCGLLIPGDDVCGPHYLGTILLPTLSLSPLCLCKRERRLLSNSSARSCAVPELLYEHRYVGPQNNEHASLYFFMGWGGRIRPPGQIFGFDF